ncbi:hypothetical protein AUR64_08215 [Haloprofundus marisrubri]|uniref:Bacterial Pleckstrin homology domain-containing protein n=1 Tax=Haloprofundus marisrubri TaxID=1514971 RepID=A0A0W1RAR9_9EURY|nr:hypothetical protein [Haloprofundus marisrubri]KTG10639.1 hypothetical protein AUR64_08215 [Haloprofundus marisrubri]
MSDEPVFREVQRFRQRWLWLLLGGVFAFSLLLGPVSIVGFAVSAAVGALLYSARLETEVRDDGVYVRFVPFHRSPRRIGWEEMTSAEATEYSPIGEFGGWGLRWRPGSVAYSVSGTEAVRIERPDEKTVVVGSQRASEFAAAIERARRQ